MEWERVLEEILKNHRGKLFGIVLGLCFGLLAALFGFWKAVFIAFCIVIGYIVGKRIDENKNFKSLLEKLFED
ncbi:DUF2273 domain-containing protein [Zhaonella formicivorans]|uniref:DUF2273 domain-containing protein n=1 Tax=Zhaonella formicivorans TaxID=2528593 RepID=UPI0010EC789A|nr:DUF2273 domain-containing protein [Zhaonella formicivorans]